MRASQLFSETLRSAPADAHLISHQLLLRAGYIRQLGPGLFSLLPPGWRALQKIRQILREELEAIGGQEVNMPLLQPGEIWQQSGRWRVMGEELARFSDSRKREMVLATMHEETAALLAASEIHSYRQLPQLIFQIQTKFRDEAFARGGLLHTREFVTADSYSFDKDYAALQKQYEAHYKAYQRVGRRVGLPLLSVKGAGTNASVGECHEFIYLSPHGEDIVALCKNCGYAARVEAAEFAKEPLNVEPAKPLEKVHTPGTASIADLSEFLGIKKHQTAKAVFYMGNFGTEQPAKLVLVMVRGDLEANETGIKRLTRAIKLRPAEAAEIAAAGCVAGFASSIGMNRKEALVIVDDLVLNSPNLVTGANEQDYHLLNSNCGRDYQPDIVGHISLAYEGAPCIHCGNKLTLEKGVEVGSLHQLGSYFTEVFSAEYLDEHGKPHPMQMGAYAMGLGRLLACIAEEHHDEYGLCLPVTVAPCQVVLLTLKANDKVRETAELLHKHLGDAGIEVLFDDRDLSPGVKFNDADLRGIPLRLTISERSLENGGVEFKIRTAKERTIIPVDEVIARIEKEIKKLKAGFLPKAE